jgi:hypothetical protein
MPPQVISATGIGVHTVVLDFSRCLDSIPLMAYENFVCGELIGSPLSVQWGVNNDFSKVLLVFPPLLPNHSYQLQVKNIRSINGILSTDTVVTFLSSGASLSEDSKHKEFTFRLEQNFPNPFNPTTKIVYSIMDSPLKRMKGSNPFVNLVIYDMLGRIVRTLVNQTQSVGEYFVQFDGTELCAGTYFYELRIDGYRSVRKMLYLR